MRHLMNRLLTVLVLFCLIGGSIGCQTVEGTGRRQLILIPASQERALGVQTYEEILKKEKISTDTRMTAILKRVGQRIANAADRPDYDWEFNLIESKQANAFALPGGKIAVYTGILPIMQHEAGMAVVLGHEVAHATARHGAERMSQGILAQGISIGASIALRDASPTTRDMILRAYGVGAKYGVLLPYSRKHEMEADHLGILLAAKAGYDPHEAVPFWERMAKAGGGAAPEFMSTHPKSERRVEQFQELMSQALAAYRRSPQFGKGARF